MDQGTAKQVVELFETSDNRSLEQVLKTVKVKYHCSNKEIDSVRKQAESLLTSELLEPEKNVDVC
jgi:hypothetical protein